MHMAIYALSYFAKMHSAFAHNPLHCIEIRATSRDHLCLLHEAKKLIWKLASLAWILIHILHMLNCHCQASGNIPLKLWKDLGHLEWNKDVNIKNISLPITQSIHQSCTISLWIKIQALLWFFSLSKKLQKYEVKTLRKIFPKPLLYDKRLGFKIDNPKPNYLTIGQSIIIKWKYIYTWSFI